MGERGFDRERTLDTDDSQRALTTDDVPEGKRLRYWREMTSQAFLDLRPERTSSEAFFGSIQPSRLGWLRLAHVRSCAQHVHRGTQEIVNSPRPIYFVNFQLEGESTCRQGREETRMTPGDFALVDATRPFELAFNHAFCHVVFELPHHVLRPRLADAEGAAGVVVRGADGLGSLVSGYLRAAATLAEPRAGDALSDTVVDLLALAFGASADAAARARPSADDARIRAMRAYVERNLADPTLAPARLAAHFRVSTRYVHKLFERHGESVMQGIVRRRLERCRDDLADPAKRKRSIADVALGWGFADLSHFGRVFRARFGVTPREWRAAEAARPTQARPGTK